MNTFQIKVLAILFMVVDHVGGVFFPQILALRIIGRLSFPLFAWLAANGSIHTSTIKNYILRLFGFGLISQIPYYFFLQILNPSRWALNIFFTLAIGVTLIAVLRENRRFWVQIVAIVLGSMGAQLFHTDYGAFGVLFIIVCFLYYRSVFKMAIVLFILVVFSNIIPEILNIVSTRTIENPLRLFEPIGLAALAFVTSYNGQEGRKMKYLFYLLYPLHLVAIVLISRFVR
jgi:hypothetical protein